MKYVNYALCWVVSLTLFIACSSQNTETKNKEEQQTPKTEEKVAEKSAAKLSTVVETLTTAPSIEGIVGDQFITARKWEDANGENVLVFSRLEKAVLAADDPEYEALSRYFYAQHFTRKEGGEYMEVRKVQDLIEACMSSNMLYLLEKSVRITDLDKDNYKEIAFLYSYGCKSDASSDPMKLMFLENGDKYAIRGERIMDAAKQQQVKELDKSFDAAPQEFRDFASKLWDEFEAQKKAYDPEEYPSQLKSIEVKY